MRHLDPFLFAGRASSCTFRMFQIARCEKQAVSLDDPRLAPFKPELSHWLDAHGADAVLVRPDRYIFGTGQAQHLSVRFIEERQQKSPGD